MSIIDYGLQNIDINDQCGHPNACDEVNFPFVLDELEQDEDDWGKILRRSKEVLFSEDTTQTTYHDALLYFSTFNAPAHLHQAGTGVCDATCDAAATADNMAYWRPPLELAVTMGADVELDQSIFNGDFGHWLRFGGDTTDSWVELGQHARFEYTLDDTAHPLYDGFELQMWVRPDTTSQTWHTLVDSGIFRVYLERDLSIQAARIWVGLQGTNGYLAYAPWPWFTWVNGEQRRVRVTYDHSASNTDVQVSVPVGGTGNPQSRLLTGAQWDIGTDDPTWNAKSVSLTGSGPVGDILIGASAGPSAKLDGYIDDFSILLRRL